MNKDYLKFFLNYKVEDFDKLHKQSFSLASNRTHKSFREGLKRIEKIYEKPLDQLNFCFLDDPKDTFDKLQSTEYSHQTNISTFCMILKLLKLVSVPLHEYNKFQNKLNLETKKNKINREEELKDKLDYLPKYNDMKKIIRDKIDNISPTDSFQDIKYLLIVSMMVLSVPLKLLQYTKMVFSFFNDEQSSISNSYTNNYIIEDLNGNYFVKTNDISIKINDSHLIKLISLWINEYNTTKHFFLQHENAKTGMNNKEIRICLNNATKHFFGESFTNIDLRSLYLKNLMDLEPSIVEKIKLSELLGYKNTNFLELHKT